MSCYTPTRDNKCRGGGCPALDEASLAQGGICPAPIFIRQAWPRAGFVPPLSLFAKPGSGRDLSRPYLYSPSLVQGGICPAPIFIRQAWPRAGFVPPLSLFAKPGPGRDLSRPYLYSPSLAQGGICPAPIFIRQAWPRAGQAPPLHLYSSPSAKRLKRRNTIFSPVSAITFFTRSPTIIVSSFTQGCIINTCSANTFLSLLLTTSSRFASGTRAIDGSSRIG